MASAVTCLFKKTVLKATSAVSAAIQLQPVRHHTGYIAKQGPAKVLNTPWLRTKLQLLNVNMKPVKKVQYTFDPFHPHVESIRKVMNLLSTERIQKSNPKCFFKTDVVCDRSEPTIRLDLEDGGGSLLFKTGNLSVEEIITMMNEYVLPRVKVEKAAVTQSKGAKSASGGGKRR